MKLKNISGQNLKVIGIGIVKKDQEVDMPDGFHNANFAPIKKEKNEKEIGERVEKKLQDNK